jgi:hypothetical protein
MHLDGGIVGIKQDFTAIAANPEQNGRGSKNSATQDQYGNQDQSAETVFLPRWNFDIRLGYLGIRGAGPGKACAYSFRGTTALHTPGLSHSNARQHFDHLGGRLRTLRRILGQQPHHQSR